MDKHYFFNHGYISFLFLIYWLYLHVCIHLLFNLHLLASFPQIPPLLQLRTFLFNFSTSIATFTFFFRFIHIFPFPFVVFIYSNFLQLNVENQLLFPNKKASWRLGRKLYKVNFKFSPQQSFHWEYRNSLFVHPSIGKK